MSTLHERLTRIALQELTGQAYVTVEDQAIAMAAAVETGLREDGWALVRAALAEDRTPEWTADWSAAAWVVFQGATDDMTKKDLRRSIDAALGEEWLPIPSAPGYEASSDGRVRSLDGSTSTKGRGRRAGRVLSPVRQGRKRNYLSVRAGGKKSRSVHGLVCEAFHGPKPTPEHMVRHLNGDSFDNRAENLKWGTAGENVRDSVRHGTHASTRKTHCRNGHEYTDKNTIIGCSGARVCRTCRNASQRRCYAKKKRAAAAEAGA